MYQTSEERDEKVNGYLGEAQNSLKSLPKKERGKLAESLEKLVKLADEKRYKSLLKYLKKILEDFKVQKVVVGLCRNAAPTAILK